jgi:hypothetical protein
LRPGHANCVADSTFGPYAAGRVLDCRKLCSKLGVDVWVLIEAAQSRWRAVNAPHLVALVRAGARFENGKLVERYTTRLPPSVARCTDRWQKQ